MVASAGAGLATNKTTGEVTCDRDGAKYNASSALRAAAQQYGMKIMTLLSLNGNYNMSTLPRCHAATLPRFRGLDSDLGRRRWLGCALRRCCLSADTVQPYQHVVLRLLRRSAIIAAVKRHGVACCVALPVPCVSRISHLPLPLPLPLPPSHSPPLSPHLSLYTHILFGTPSNLRYRPCERGWLRRSVVQEVLVNIGCCCCGMWN